MGNAHMLPLGLTTNEVMNNAGVEVEFERWKNGERSAIYAKVGELPNAENRIQVSHQDIGTGIEARRRSATIGTLRFLGVSGKMREIKFTINADIPVGDIANYDNVNLIGAQVGSLVFTTGTSTFKYDGTGNGFKAIRDGTI